MGAEASSESAQGADGAPRSSSPPPPPPPSAPQRQPGRGFGPWVRFLLWTLAIIAVLWAGLWVRKWTYQHTEPIRHLYDIKNNLYYGSRALDEGWLDLYGNIRSENGYDYKLDYVPLRLLVMRQWAAWTRWAYGGEVDWQSDYAFTRPLLLFNAAMEALAALAVFLLVRMWVGRAERAGAARLAGDAPRASRRATAAGVCGALMLWFSPAVQISAHAWPSWDIWVVPFFLWAVLLGCVDFWFCAGVVLGVGTMFKGQQLMVAPLFILWPLFMGRWRAAVRWGVGYVFAAAMIVSPWLLRDELTRQVDLRSLAWALSTLVACGVLLASAIWLRHRWYSWLAAALAAGLIAWPALQQRQDIGGLLAAALAVAVALPGRMLPLSRQGYVAAGAVAGVLVLCPVLFFGDMSWWDVAFRYGSQKFDYLQQLGADTLPALLGSRFGFRSVHQTVWTIEPGAFPGFPAAPLQVSLGAVLAGLYGIVLALSALGMALHTRRGDRRFLAAMTVPWLAAFLLLPRMHSRYLLFGATVGAVLAGVSLGAILLDLILIAVAWLGTIHLLLGNYYGHYGTELPLGTYLPERWAMIVERLLAQTNPDIAWALLLILAMLLYLALAPTRRATLPLPAPSC